MKNKRFIMLTFSFLLILFCSFFGFNAQISYAAGAPDTQAPTIPTDLAASSVDVTSITLSWTASTDNTAVKGYQIFRDGTKIGTSGSTGYIAKCLTPNKTYSFTVKAYDAANNLSEESTALVITTLADIDPPTAPTNLSSSEVTTTAVGFIWDTGTDNVKVKGYNIYRNGVKVASTSSCKYTNKGLLPAADYQYTLKSYDAAGNLSDFSEPLAVTTLPDTSDPSVPGNPSYSSLTCSSVKLSWEASTDDSTVKGYRIFRDGVKIATTCSTSYINKCLLPQSTYTYTIKAYDIVGKLSADSMPVTITTNADLQPPSAPAGFIVKTVTGTSAALAWSASADDSAIKGYNIFRDGVKVYTTKCLYYTDTNLIPGTTYVYAAVAIDLGDNSSQPSDALSVTTSNIPCPPTNLKVSAKSETSLTINWTASRDSAIVEGYDIYRDGSLVGSVAGTSFEDAGLTQDTSYVYTVKAYNFLHGSSDASMPLNAATCQLITGQVTWSADNGPYTIDSGLVIAEDSVLQILPGTVVRIDPGESVFVKGVLNGSGEEGNRVIFTSTKDPAHGGSGITGSADYWKTISISPAGEFTGNYVDVFYGNVLMNVQGTLTLMSAEIAYANTTGIVVSPTGEFNGTDIRIHDCCHVETCKGIIAQGIVNLIEAEIYDCPGTGVLIASTGSFNGTMVTISNCDKGIEIQGTLNFIQSQVGNCNYGMYFNSTNFSGIILNSFINNNLYGIYNNIPDEVIIDAPMNYWGSPNGPSVFNEDTQIWEGDGDRVSKGVTYDGWLTAPAE